MEIVLTGHDYRYAVEQMLFTLYPGEKPVYPAAPTGSDCVEVTMRRGKTYTTAVCRLTLGGQTFRGESRTRSDALTTKMVTDRYLQRIVKLSFYRAALSAGHPVPQWGALTGVRPGKLMTSFLRAGCSEKQALRRFEREFDVSPRRSRLTLDAAKASLAARNSLGDRDVCIYIGIPFCPTRCAYCSFISLAAPRELDRLMVPYLAALEKEIQAVAAVVKEAGCRVAALYVGGGTPTTLSARQLDRLLSVVRESFDLSSLRELTVEAGRPDTVTAEKIQVLSRHGVSRVSVNPQTMSDEILAAIGRLHTAQQIREAMALVRANGDFEVNMDLIAGLPGDTPQGFADTVEAVLAMNPENITIHTLALKKGSFFLQNPTLLPDGEAVGAMLDEAESRLTAAGFAPYYLYRQKYMSGSFENVGWTLPGHENLYNICIMEELTGILAIGAGGSTKLVTPGGAVQRLSPPKYPREYIERIDDTCAAKARILEFYQGE